MHWADVIAEKLLEKGKEHVVSSGITPSGPIHVGSMREILTADAIARAIRDKGGEAELIYVADTADPLRKVYPFLENLGYEKWVGYPLAEIPAPNDEGTYADYFLNPFFEALNAVGVNPRVVDNYKAYKEGKYVNESKNACDNIEKIREILETVSGRQLPKNWFPWTFVNDDGKMISGKVLKYEWPIVEFEDENGDVFTNNIEKGEGKLPWRLDWPAKWNVLGVTFEAFGKDHATKGGSYDSGVKIVRDIYGGTEPEKTVYEWINLKGEGAMHSSTGLAISANEILEVIPPEVLRWLIMKPQPNRHIDFDPGIGILNLTGDYERVELDYNKNEEKTDVHRAYELSQVDTEMKESGDLLGQVKSYRNLLTLVQSKSSLEDMISSLKRIGILEESTEEIEEYLGKRVEYVKNWLARYAPDEIKFEIKKETPENEFDDEQKKVIKEIVTEFNAIEWNAEEIHNSFYRVQDKSEMEAKKIFEIVYLALLGQNYGPKMGFFLATNLEREFVVERLESY